MPKLLEEVIKLRKKYKAEYKKNPNDMTKATSNAYKLLANASYGYLGFFGARWYCPEAAASATAISRKFIKKTIDTLGEEGYKIIYADTDSVAFLLENKTRKQAMDTLKKLNSSLPGVMELELEDFYKRGIWVSKRTKEAGAKKKYALINYEGKMKIRGFETVRRDWCYLARDLQNKVLKKILEEGNEISALKYTKEIIKKLRERKIDKSQLVIKTQLKKPISEYLSEGPHVAIAKKMMKLGMPIDVGMLVQYYIAETEDKKALIRDKAKLPDEKGDYNLDYYINNQILPAVENIFQVFNINMKETADNKKQTKLSGF